MSGISGASFAEPAAVTPAPLEAMVAAPRSVGTLTTHRAGADRSRNFRPHTSAGYRPTEGAAARAPTGACRTSRVRVRHLSQGWSAAPLQPPWSGSTSSSLLAFGWRTRSQSRCSPSDHFIGSGGGRWGWGRPACGGGAGALRWGCVALRNGLLRESS